MNAKADFVNPYTNVLRSREQGVGEKDYKPTFPTVAASIEIKGDDVKKNGAKQPAEVKKGSERPKVTIKDMVVTPVLESRKVKAAVGDSLPGKGTGSRNDKQQVNASLSMNPSQTQVLDFNREPENTIQHSHNKNESITNIQAKNLYVQKANLNLNCSSKQKIEESNRSANDDQDTAKPEESEPPARGLIG